MKNYNEIIELEILNGIDKVFHVAMLEHEHLHSRTEFISKKVEAVAAELKFRTSKYIDMCLENKQGYFAELEKRRTIDEYGGVSIDLTL